MMTKPVTKAAAREQLYIEAFIQNGGDKRAAGLAAGCKTERAADQYAQRVSKNVEIQREIARRQAESLALAKIETGISVERTLREVARLAYADIGVLYDEHGNLKEVSEWPADARAAVAGLETVEEFRGSGKDREHVGYSKKVKLHDKNAALDKLMKNLGLYREDNAQQPQQLPPMFVIVPVRARTVESK